jgi:hypothetical protein
MFLLILKTVFWSIRMSDEIEKEEEVEAKYRSSKAEIATYIGHILDLVAGNTPKAAILKSLGTKFNIKPIQAQRYFVQATEQLESDLADKTKAIRDRRIHALNKDVKEAYDNYISEEDNRVRLQWWDAYQRAKNQLDTYYPNKLSPDSEKEDIKIEISYQPVQKNSGNDEDS